MVILLSRHKSLDVSFFPPISLSRHPWTTYPAHHRSSAWVSSNLNLGLCNMWRYWCHTLRMSGRRWGRWSVPVSRHLLGCPSQPFGRGNLSNFTRITDPNVLCHLLRLKSIQSPPSGALLTNVPKRRKISHSFSPCLEGTDLLSWEWASNTKVSSADSDGKSSNTTQRSPGVFVRVLVGAKLLEMASAMARISFFNGGQPSLMPPVNKRKIAVAHLWRLPPEKIHFLGKLNT